MYQLYNISCIYNTLSEAPANNKTELNRLDTALPTEQEFYELTRSKVLNMLKTTDIMVLDTICSEFVANLRAGDDSTPVIKLKPPYNLMTELDEISSGREEVFYLKLLDYICSGRTLPVLSINSSKGSSVQEVDRAHIIVY